MEQACGGRLGYIRMFEILESISSHSQKSLPVENREMGAGGSGSDLCEEKRMDSDAEGGKQ